MSPPQVQPGEVAWPSNTAPPAPTPPAAPPSVAPPPAASAAAAQPPSEPVEVDTLLMRSARMLAGQPVDPPSTTAVEAVRDQNSKLAPAMDEFEDKSGKGMRAWAAQHLSSAAGQTVLYPFSGPDFLTIHRLYPDASRYVLVALQDGGLPPVIERMSERTASATLRVHARAMSQFAQKGFFVTAKLGKGYSVPGAWTGISGMLMAFAVLEGYDVIHAAPLRLGDKANDVTVIESPNILREDWSSLRLWLRDHNGKIVLLDYLDADLSNNGLRAETTARRTIERAAEDHVLIKAASHLLQFPPFSLLRDIIVERTKELVQDETGVKYSDLLASFNVALYGRFVGVNPLFDPRPQRALKRAYEGRSDIPPLDFAIGYTKPAGPCLMVATRK